MTWFRRWLVVAVVLVVGCVAAWKLFLATRLPADIGVMIFYVGVGAIVLGGLLALGATVAAIEERSAPPSLGLDAGDGPKQLARLFEASPAVWAFVLVGAVAALVGSLMAPDLLW